MSFRIRDTPARLALVFLVCFIIASHEKNGVSAKRGSIGEVMAKQLAPLIDDSDYLAVYWGKIRALD